MKIYKKVIMYCAYEIPDYYDEPRQEAMGTELSDSIDADLLNMEQSKLEYDFDWEITDVTEDKEIRQLELAYDI